MILIRIYFGLYFEIESEENYRSFFSHHCPQSALPITIFLEQSVKIKPTFSKMAQINRKLCLERRGRKRKGVSKNFSLKSMKIIGQFLGDLVALHYCFSSLNPGVGTSV